MTSARLRAAFAIFCVTLFLTANFAISAYTDDEESTPVTDAVSHGILSEIEPPEIYRSKMFSRLGSIAINVTPCLHDTSTDASKSFVCTHDTFGVDDAHGNGAHFSNLFYQFDDWFVDRFANDAEYFISHGIKSWTDLKDVTMRSHGVSEDGVKSICQDKAKPLENALDLPDAAKNLTTMAKIIASSICRFTPLYYDSTWAKPWEWWQLDYHTDHDHEEDASPASGLPTSVAEASSPAVRGAGEAQEEDHDHGGHLGPHGIDFDAETNWLFAAQSHLGTVSMVNLNVIDWGKVATYEEETGYRVLLFDEESVFNPEAVLYYASNLLLKNRNKEAEFARSLDVIHRYCFSENERHLSGTSPPWSDELTAPDAELANALTFIRNEVGRAEDLVKKVPPNTRGWACFLAFTGIDARAWTDPAFSNPFCTHDTRHLARYDGANSPGTYSRFNPYHKGAGDAWRCDWFVRYIDVTADFEMTIRRPVPIDSPHDFTATIPGHVDGESLITQLNGLVPARDSDVPVDLTNQEWVEFPVNVSIGPHDLVYNPVNSMVYVTHYWQSDDPDIRLLPDWTIHAINANPATQSFNNPYLTVGGPPSLSCQARAWMPPGMCYSDYANLPSARNGSSRMTAEPYPIDVGGPVDGLHPVTVDVDIRDGSVLVVNRESNTISVLQHDGNFDLRANKLDVTLAGAPQIGIQWDASKLRSVGRDYSIYRDPDSSALPTPEQMSGKFILDPNFARDDCDEFIVIDDSNATSILNAAFAQELCNKGLLTTTGIDNAALADKIRPFIRGMVSRVIGSESQWDLLLADLRVVLASTPVEFLATSEEFLKTWSPRLTSKEDRAFLVDGLSALAKIAPDLRATPIADFFAHADARMPGRSAAFAEELVQTVMRGPLSPALLQPAPYDIVSTWQQAAQDGSLAGFVGVSITLTKLQAMVEMVEPASSGGAVTGAWWLEYCLAFSIDDWIFHLEEGNDPWEARGKESDNGKHPFHCDDVSPIHYPRATPIQTDYAGVSNHHAVTIIREPLGPLLLDFWYEARPRILQPFDIWINPGDDNIYISNLGNHDNLPILDGWLSIIQRRGGPSCHTEWGEGLLGGILPLGLPQVDLPKLSCTIPRPPGGAQANLLIPMGVQPHHLNVNPYTFEVYGGHLASDFIRVAQLENERIDWAIMKQTVTGSGEVADADAVPLTNPTGMGVNPSTQRLFMSHFLDPEPRYVPLTGRMEQMGDYVGIMDLRNYTLLPDMIFGGDHHVSIDQIRPPTYEQPFYNRLRELNIDGESRVGSMGLVANTGNLVDLFWRCTYYRLTLDPTVDTIKEGEVRVRSEHHLKTEIAGQQAAPFNFTSGRCFNMFDLNPQMPRDEPLKIDEHGAQVFEDNPIRFENGTIDANVVWEYGEEHIRFGMLNLWLDPENVPANLRVIAPSQRDTGRSLGASIQASEELASAWMEADTPERATIPTGSLTMTLPLAMPNSALANRVDGGARTSDISWDLSFDTSYQVEWEGPRPVPARRDRLLLNISQIVDGVERTTDIANWSMDTFAGPAWTTTRIGLAPLLEPGVPARVTVTFDSGDDVANDRRGWAIGGVSIVDANGHACPYADAEPLCEMDSSRLDSFERGGIATEVIVEDPFRPERTRKAIAFQDASTGNYESTDAHTIGEFSFNITLVNGMDDELIILHRPDVEDPTRAWRPGNPYDEMYVEASMDGGITWHDIWKKDSRDTPRPSSSTVVRDITNLTLVASGDWATSMGLAAPTARPLFRFRFDALDPAYNQFPGWEVSNVKLVKRGAGAPTAIPLIVSPDEPIATTVGDMPVWHELATGSGAYAFRNSFGTYETNRGAGGYQGVICRLDHNIFGSWSGGITRGPGSGAITFCARDLAGHVTELTHTDGRGVLFVEDSFERASFTENYWKRDETDPNGIGYAAYVYDPTPDGMGDLVPKDTPVDFRNVGTGATLNPGRGELLSTSRGLLLEVPPIASNKFFEFGPLNTEMTATVGDGADYRRAFVITPADADKERIPEEAARILDQEDGWLNATHVKLLRPPTPVLKAIDEVQKTFSLSNLMANNHKHQFDFAKIVNDTIDSAKLLAHGLTGNLYGMRRGPADTYVLDGTRDLPQVASERLSHTFPFKREASTPQAVDFSFDVVPRHRIEQYIVQGRPGLPRLDLDLLNYIIHNVTLDRLEMTKSELESVVGPLKITDAVWNDTAWLANNTLGDVEKGIGNILDNVDELGRNLLSIRVPVSEILNDLDRFQMSLPTFGEAFGVNVTLKGPDGPTHVLAVRDGVDLNREIDFTPEALSGDIRISVAPSGARGAFNVKLGWDLSRFEKLRLHLDAAQADQVFSQTGDYTLAITSTIRSGDAPVPGVFYEIGYGRLELAVQMATASGGNEAPNADFAWTGPVNPGESVRFLPGRRSSALGDLEDQDGYIRTYKWTLPASATSIRLEGAPLVDDSDASAFDDIRIEPFATSNARATRFGKLANSLTNEIQGNSRVIEYNAFGCEVPTISASFLESGTHQVTLTVTDDKGARTSLTQELVVGAISGRPPELVVDPIDDVNGTQLWWQPNPGSLMLESRGRALNLTRLIDFNATPVKLDDLQNQTLLTASLDDGKLSAQAEISRADVEVASKKGIDLVNAIIDHAIALPDLLLDTILLRPGSVRVITKDAEPSPTMTRMQILLGSMPGSKIDELPLLGNALNQSIGFANAPSASRFATMTDAEFADLKLTLSEICEGSSSANASDFCVPELDDVLRLLREGALDAWTFRYAIHPDVNGVADTSRTLAQVLMVDNGVTSTYFAVIEGVDEIIRIPGEAARDIDNVTDLALAVLDPIVPLRHLVDLANAIFNESAFVSTVGEAAVKLDAVIAAPTIDRSDPLAVANAVNAAANALLVAPTNVSDALARIDALRDDIVIAQAEALAFIESVGVAAEQDLARFGTGSATTVSNVFTNISADPIEEKKARLAAQVQFDLAGATAALQSTSAELRTLVDKLSAANNVTLAWAYNWTDVLASGDPSLLLARVNDTKNAAVSGIHRVDNATADYYRRVTGPIRRILETILDPAPIIEASSEVPITLAYDGSSGKAFVRVGSRIIAEGTLSGAPVSAIHASLTMTSIGTRKAEVQALWGGGGSALRDGFNTLVPALDPAKYDVASIGKANTSARAYTKMFPDGTDASMQAIWITRSAEGRMSKRGQDSLADEVFDVIDEAIAEVIDVAPSGEYPNRHRFASDSRGSPPSAGAASIIDSIVRTQDAMGVQPPAAVLALADDPNTLYSATVDVPTGAIQEYRVARSTVSPPSAPAVHVVAAPPPAPFIFDVGSHRDAAGVESLRIAFQDQGVSNPPVEFYDVYAAPRPDPSPSTHADHKTFVGRVMANAGPIDLGSLFGEKGWTPGVDYRVLDTSNSAGPIRDDWRYFVVRGHNARGDGPFSTPFRMPPTLLDETFSLLRAGPLNSAPGMTVEQGSGDIDLDLPGLPDIRLETCFGDRIAISRQMNYPHDEIAARWARALHIKERGLDSIFALVRDLGVPLSEIPVDLSFLDVPVADIDLDLCPSVRELIGTLNGIDLSTTTVLELLELSPQPTVPEPDLNLDPILGPLLNGRVIDAWSNLSRALLGNLSIDLNVGKILNGTPATVTWRTEEVTGPYYARVRFLVPNPLKLPAINGDTTLDGILPSTQLGFLNALVSTERFHLLQLGHESNGEFTNVINVDLDPHLLAPLDVAATIQWIREIAELSRDPVGSIATLDLPVVYGLRAGDGEQKQQHIANADLEHWYTLEVYAPSKDADVYTVFLNGDAVGQFRTAKRMAPNALRIGGTNMPAEVYVDDVRFMNAIHPPAPIAQVAPLGENYDFATVRWHVPENGGAPITDFNLARIDLDTADFNDAISDAQIVASTAAGGVRTMIDPESSDLAPGAKFAYAVQAVNGIRYPNANSMLPRNVGPFSDARAIRLPGFVRVSGDTAIAHEHEIPNADDSLFDGGRRLTTGGANAAWRSVYQVNVSDATDSRGRTIAPADLGSAMFLVYALGTGAPTSGPNSIVDVPTPAELRRIKGLPRNVEPGTMLGSCPDEVAKLLLLGHECRDVTPEPIEFTGLCEDASRDLELEEIPFNCWENGISAFISPSTAYNIEDVSWANQPRTEYWAQDTGIARQTTRSEAWRRYELLPALLRGGTGDFSVTLKKEAEKTGSGVAQYAATEASSWLDDRIGPSGRGPETLRVPFADGAGPGTFPWTQETVKSGERAIEIGGRSGVSSVKFAPTGAVTVPFDVPIKMRAYIPEGSSPREIGMRLAAGISTRSGSTAGRSCGEYGWTGGNALVTWGEDVVNYDGERLVIDFNTELDHGADILTPSETFTGYHVGGIPTARGRWVTLTFDPGQLALEMYAQAEKPKQLLDVVFDVLTSLRGPDSNKWLPSHLDDREGIYNRLRPTSFVERIDSHTLRGRDVIDMEPPYFYHIVPWLFFFQNYDAFIEPWHCGLNIRSIELFTVDGTIFVDQLGPDIAPRIRIDTGGDLE